MLEACAIDLMLENALLTPTVKVENKKLALTEACQEQFDQWVNVPSIPCGVSSAHQYNDGEESFTRMTMSYRPLSPERIAPYWMAALEEVEKLYKQKANSGDAAAKAFYRYQLRRIASALAVK